MGLFKDALRHLGDIFILLHPPPPASAGVPIGTERGSVSRMAASPTAKQTGSSCANLRVRHCGQELVFQTLPSPCGPYSLVQGAPFEPGCPRLKPRLSSLKHRLSSVSHSYTRMRAEHAERIIAGAANHCLLHPAFSSFSQQAQGEDRE